MNEWTNPFSQHVDICFSIVIWLNDKFRISSPQTEDMMPRITESHLHTAPLDTHCQGQSRPLSFPHYQSISQESPPPMQYPYCPQSPLHTSESQMLLSTQHVAGTSITLVSAPNRPLLTLYSGPVCLDFIVLRMDYLKSTLAKPYMCGFIWPPQGRCGAGSIYRRGNWGSELTWLIKGEEFLPSIRIIILIA